MSLIPANKLMSAMELSTHFGRVYCLQDYRSMFDLNGHDLQGRILDYPAKISCFNAEMYGMGHNQVISADAKYDLTPLDMAKHVDYVIQELAEKLSQSSSLSAVKVIDVVEKWRHYGQNFLADYSDGSHTGRYQAVRLPKLPFSDHQFDLALCSDLLLLQNGYELIDVVNEVARVAREVRIFPLLNAEGKIVEELGPTLLTLQESNIGLEVRQVFYEHDSKNNAMLRLWVKECVVE